MRKLLLLVLTVVGLFGNNYELTFNNLNYVYNYSTKKCESQDYEGKMFFLKSFRNGDIIVDTKADTTPGYITTVIGKINGKELEFSFMNTYGACRLFQDYIVNNKKVNPDDYVDMKEK